MKDFKHILNHGKLEVDSDGFTSLVALTSIETKALKTDIQNKERDLRQLENDIRLIYQDNGNSKKVF